MQPKGKEGVVETGDGVKGDGVLMVREESFVVARVGGAAVVEPATVVGSDIGGVEDRGRGDGNVI